MSDCRSGSRIWHGLAGLSAAAIISPMLITFLDINACKAVVIALGYGQTQGVPHKSKSIEEVTNVNGEISEWFKKSVEFVLLAPTAMKEQKLTLSLEAALSPQPPKPASMQKQTLAL